MADAKTFCDWSVLDDLAESLTHLNIGVKGQLQSTFLNGHLGLVPFLPSSEMTLLYWDTK